MKKLAIITSHPIQYNAPLFELLTKRRIIDCKIFYTWGESVLQDKFDPGFGKVINWDIPLLQGYSYEFVENTATDKGSHHFKGIINPGIIDTINKYNPDVILVYGWSFSSHLKVMRHFKNKVPILFRGDSNLLDQSGFIASLKRTVFLRWLYRYVDKALYVGKNNYDYFRKAGLKKQQLILAPHAIDNDRFTCNDDHCKNTAVHLRESLQIPASDFVFLFAGKLEPKKDPALLIDAFKRAGFTDDVHLVITGNGVLEETLKAQKVTNLHFLDFQNQGQMPALYDMASALVLPSRGPGETWGLAINEAMANGKPVIASTKCGGAIDLIEDGCNGYLFTAGDVKGLKDKLMLLYKQKDQQEVMKRNALEKIKNFSLDKLAIAIESTVLTESKKA